MSVLGLIPARGGSKGLPGKNIRPLCGRPLLGWSVRAARLSGVIDRIVLSTDDPEIARVGENEGAVVPFLRPASIATDTAAMIDVVTHAIEAETAHGHRPETIVLLQPTSPLRRPEHIREAVNALRDTGGDSVVSVVPVPAHLCPDYVLTIRDGVLEPFLPEGANVRRRQDVRPAWYRDGTIYAFRRDTVEKHRNIYGVECRPMILNPSFSCTIDTVEDFDEAERRLRQLLATSTPQ